MAIEDAITNDPAIERHGSEAAAKYMAWHWAALSKAAGRDANACILTESRQSDDRLYGCFRASICPNLPSAWTSRRRRGATC